MRNARAWPDVTRQLARYAVHSRFDRLPAQVQAESVRAFLNWVGCAFGGCREPAVEAAIKAGEFAGNGGAATIIGHGIRSDMGTAAFINCLSSAVLAFDDTHLPTVTHPTGPVAAALLAYAETNAVSGEAFLNALSLGMEIECRLSNALLLPPARADLRLYVTGLTGPIGAAAALGNVMGLDEARMCWAIGLAASMASGLRATHGSMAGAMVPAIGARNAVHAATLAAQGFDCSETFLEADRGFFDVFSPDADPGLAVAGLGKHFEVLANAYKPYPCGIVIQPAIDACLETRPAEGPAAPPRSVRLTVHPLTLTLTDRRRPKTFFEAQISLYHWAAIALLRGAADSCGLRQETIEAPDIVELRERIEVGTSEQFGRDEAAAEVVWGDGTVRHAHVTNARGSAARPMTDAELDAKFRSQTTTVLSGSETEALLDRLRRMTVAPEVANWIAPALSPSVRPRA